MFVNTLILRPFNFNLSKNKTQTAVTNMIKQRMLQKNYDFKDLTFHM